MSLPNNQTFRPVWLNVAFRILPFIIVLLFTATSLSFAQNNSEKTFYSIVYATDTTKIIPANDKSLQKTSVLAFLKSIEGTKITNEGSITCQEMPIKYININEVPQTGDKVMRALKKLSVGDIDVIRVINDYRQGCNLMKPTGCDWDAEYLLDIITKKYKPQYFTGVVFTNNNIGVPGAKVQVDRTAFIQYTDVIGYYHINIPPGKKRLIISYFGYKTDTLTIGKINNTNINLTKN